MSENAAGWKVIIKVPQLNGTNEDHLWIAAIPNEREVRARLLLSEIPCESRFEPLSADQLVQLGLERNEVRRVLISEHGKVTDVPIDPVAGGEGGGDNVMGASREEPAGDANERTEDAKPASAERSGPMDQKQAHHTEQLQEHPSTRFRSGDRLWHRLWAKTQELKSR